jgi:hypothetical protein
MGRETVAGIVRSDRFPRSRECGTLMQAVQCLRPMGNWLALLRLRGAVSGLDRVPGDFRQLHRIRLILLISP